MGRVAKFARQIRWYWASLMGDNAYARYLEHHARTTPANPRSANATTGRPVTPRQPLTPAAVEYPDRNVTLTAPSSVYIDENAVRLTLRSA